MHNPTPGSLKPMSPPVQHHFCSKPDMEPLKRTLDCNNHTSLCHIHRMSPSRNSNLATSTKNREDIYLRPPHSMCLQQLSVCNLPMYHSPKGLDTEEKQLFTRLNVPVLGLRVKPLILFRDHQNSAQASLFIYY